jgi:hypothetical protein
VLTIWPTDILAKRLGPTRTARWDARDSPHGCLAGTRETLLSQLQIWAEEKPAGLSVFWLTGLAGSGKSAIAKSFCERIAAQSSPLLAFFASKQDARRRDVLGIVHTLAYQLAESTGQAAVRRQILIAVRSPPDVMARSVEEQIERLLAQPLALAVRTDPFPVLVIDALDACDVVEIAAGNSLISHLVSLLRPYPIRILVTSRHEDHMTQMLDILRSSLAHGFLRFHDIEDSTAETDIGRYLAHSFAHLRHIQPNPPAEWPPAQDLATLVERSGPLFVFAATAMSFISNPLYAPPNRLRQLLDRQALSSTVESPLSALDRLYAQVLEAAVDAATMPSADDVVCARIRELLGALTYMQQPLSIESLSTLLNLDVKRDADALSTLLAARDIRIGVVADTESSAVLRISHISFSEFLTDPARGGRFLQGRFLIAPGYCHSRLASCCLTTLDALLTDDLCAVHDLLRLDFDMSGLRERMPPALRYALAHWAFHVGHTDAPDSALLEKLGRFCETQLMQWVKAGCLLVRLSPMFEAPHGARDVRGLIAWYKVCTYS